MGEDFLRLHFYIDGAPKDLVPDTDVDKDRRYGALACQGRTGGGQEGHPRTPVGERPTTYRFGRNVHVSACVFEPGRLAEREGGGLLPTVPVERIQTQAADHL